MRRTWFNALAVVSTLSILTGITLLIARSDVVAALIPTPTPTLTPTATATPAPTATSTATPTPIPTDTPTPTPTPPQLALQIALSGARIGQGKPILVKVSVSRPATVTASLEGRAIPLHASGGAHWGMFGISRLATLGPRTLTVSARDSAGVSAAGRVTFEVAATSFRSETIDAVPRRFDPAEFVKERNLLTPIWNTVTPRQLWTGLFIRPSEGEVNSSFGLHRIWRDGSRDVHEGTDFLVGGGKPVYAANDGVVALAQPLVVRGQVVIINHGLGVYTGYYHLSEIMVHKGEVVVKGQLVGKVGATGYVTGAHLHWNLWVNGVDVDPMDWTTNTYNTLP